MEGKILSIESMGLVDGPGIRTVVFFSGCALRCQFCHNPDSWNMQAGQLISSDEIIKKILRFRPYFARSGGGVTFSGGEPLLQKDFLIELLKGCKKEGIHTCLDTAGAGTGDYEEILSLTDLVLYDVKAISPEKYLQLCGRDIAETEKFQAALAKSGTPVTVRQVVIPDYNDSDEYMRRLAEYIQLRIPTTQKVELLPYHCLGEHKYKSLGIAYPLAGLPPMDTDKTKEFEKKYFTF